MYSIGRFGLFLFSSKTILGFRMKIVKLVPGVGFSVLQDVGALQTDFLQNSLLAQLLPHLETMPLSQSPGEEQQYLVFDETEEACIILLFRQLAGGLVRDRGHGHIDRGEIVAFNCHLQDLYRVTTYIPKHLERDGRKPIREIEEWSLAIQ